jgi:hypothetical protein
MRQCAAVRAAVRGSARDSSVRQCRAVCDSAYGCVRATRAVRAAVCGSALGSVRQCGSNACVAVRQWLAVRYVWQCAAVCGSARGSV